MVAALLPAATRPLTVRLQVSDLRRSVDWYTVTLGCRVLDLRASKDATLGTADGTPLVTLVERPGTQPVRPHSRLGLYHFALLLPTRADLGAYVGRLAAIDVQVGSADHLVSEALYMSDPDGLGIEVYADRPRELWTWHDGHVAMAVDPLDLRDLARAATAPWDGLPDGTTLGHVHLHVGDLAQASAFYQHAVGFDEVVAFSGARFLSAGGYHHHLGLNVWAEGAPPAGETDARLLEWTLHVPDATAAAASRSRLTSAGHSVHDNHARDGWHVADPWGTRLRIVASGP